MKDHKKRQMWYRIVTTLAVVVVFVTTYMLILPAITMENKAECGITEHKHDANCYSSHYEKEKELACTTDSLGVHKHTEACYDAEHKLICGYADFVIHEHDASCYDKDGNLVCTIPEHKLHQHTPECYQMQKQLVCTQEESLGHTHTPECYTKQQGSLICGKEEHTHGEGCYDAEGNLICTLEEHTHSDECYEWTDVLTCTIPESAGHTHSEACYQDVQVLICEEPAELHTHTAECYKDGVLACGKLELKEHKHSETCFTEKQNLVETLICDRVEHVHTDECYKKSTEETATSEAVTASQNEETSSEDESSETASIEETSSEETSIEETSLEEASTEETSIEETSIEETSLEAVSEDETEAESETETAEEAESESEVESESESETEESSSIEAESEEESSEEVSTEEESSEEESFEETSTEETSEEELTSEEASTEEETSEAEEESSELPQLTGFWPMDMMEVAHALVGSTEHDLVKFCLDYIGISDMGYDSDLTTWIDNLTELNLYSSREDLIPSPGDVIFFDNDGDGIADHVGIITDVTENEEDGQELITVAQSNHDGLVEEQEYQTDDERIVGHWLFRYNASILSTVAGEETYLDFLQYVTSFTGDKTKYDPTTGTYSSNLKINFEIKKQDIEKNGYNYELKYPDGIIVPDDLLKDEHELPDENNTVAGKFHFIKNNDGTYSIRIKFDPSYVANAGEKITGHAWFNGKIGEEKTNEDGNIVVTGSDKLKLEIPKNEITYPADETNNYNLKITKDGNYNPETGKLEYKVVVYSTKGTPDKVNFSDIIKIKGMKLESPNVTVIKKSVLDNKNGWVTENETGESVSVNPSYDPTTGKLTMTLPKMETKQPDKDGRIGYDKYYITYTYDVSDMEIGILTADNNARVESKDKKTDKTIFKEDDNKISIKNEHSISKTHVNETDNGRIKWTITLNENQINIANSTLKDDMLAKLMNGTDIQISPSTGVEVNKDGGKITSITFKPMDSGKNTNKYTITYYTAIESSWKTVEISNTATFKPSEGGEIGVTDKTTVGGGDVDKTMDKSEVSADGKTANVNWTVSVIVPAGSLPKNTVITDTAMENLESRKHYFTADQIKNWNGAFHWENEVGNLLESGNFTDASKFEVKFIGSDGKEYSYSEAIAITGNAVTFNKITVKLLEELKCVGASKLKFSYSTTADLSNASFGDNPYYNTVKVDDKEKKVAYHYYKAGIIKSDGNDKTDTTSATNDGELTWKIKVMTDDRDYQILTVTDDFPTGVKLTELSIKLQGGSWSDAKFTINEDGTLQGSGRFCDEFLTDGSTYQNDKLTLLIKNKNGGNMSKNLKFEITVKCQVKNAQTLTAGTQYIFTNKASAKEGDIEIGSSSQTQEWTKKDNTVVKKVVDKSGAWDEKSHKAKYSIVLNPEEKDLVERTDVLTLVDKFACYNTTYWVDGAKTSEVTVHAELIPNSVKLYYAVKDEQGNYVPGTEVSGWSWTYKNEQKTNWQNWTEHILTVSGVPDQKVLIFKYDYIIERDAPDEAKNMKVNLVNEAELFGTDYKDDSGQKEYIWQESAAGGGVTTDKNYTLYKVEKDNYGKLLSGAVFKLQQYKNSQYEDVTPATTFMTNADGIIKIKWDDKVFEKNVLYRLVETQAPSGYKIPENAESDSQTIRFYFSDKSSTENVLPTEIPSGAIDLTKTSHTAYIENEVTETITLPETGGTGTYWYTMGGVLLTAGAAFLIYKKHMQKGGRRIW